MTAVKDTVSGDSCSDMILLMDQTGTFHRTLHFYL